MEKVCGKDQLPMMERLLISMKVIIEMIKNADREFFNGLLVIYIKGSILMMSGMVKI